MSDEFWAIVVAGCGIGWGLLKAFEINYKVLCEIRDSIVAMEFAQRKARGDDWPDLR